MPFVKASQITIIVGVFSNVASTFAAWLLLHLSMYKKFTRVVIEETTFSHLFKSEISVFTS